MKNAIKIIVSLILSLSTFISCTTTQISPNEDALFKSMARQLTTLNGTEWSLANYSNAKFEKEYKNLVSLSFSDNIDNSISYSGKSFVNNYAGFMKIDESKGLFFEKKPMLSTLIGADANLMKLDSLYYSDLDRAKLFEIDSNNNLIIYLGDNKSNSDFMTFTKIR